MGTVRNIAIAVLLISFFTFVAFFGRLPALRSLDQRLTNGRLSSSITRFAHVLWNDRHPTVMIFFILLLAVSEFLFLPPAWDLLSPSRKITAITLLILPYLYLYLSANGDPGYVTPENHSDAMTLYPYDFAVFHPGQKCKTCKFLKPARSKHCSICKHCISKMDHHCIFINNCVGYRNQHWFLLLLLTTAILITYAAYIGLSVCSAEVVKRVSRWTLLGKGFTWSEYFNIWGWVLQEYTRIGGVTLLCLLTNPMVWGLLAYHLYLIWAGTTTNESMKWSDWQADMADGFAFRCALDPDRQKDSRIEPAWTRWPVEAAEVVMRNEEGLPPTGATGFGGGQWERVWRLADVENLYDLGFWRNIKDVFLPRHGLDPRSRPLSLPSSPGVR
ncbi:Palmitoyltransferase SWF1 [Lachnellula suecica]|uniref:Palmitoyltransferase n=1 Tax=Lachnellula suecica TaxID=602035 RepID=A0A8T9C5N8_9HELO|nr:Palmitoyltransferase SWF1 [Lachnellula suecica]